MKQRIIKGLLASGLSASLAVGGWYLTSISESPGGQPILTSYADTGGIYTICNGSIRDINGNPILPNTTYTEDQCAELFVKDYVEHYNQMRKHYKGGFMSVWQEASVVDFVFNKGQTAFANSTLLKHLKAGNHYLACEELLKWVYGRTPQGGKVVITGLVNRANREYQWCIGNTPSEAVEALEELYRGSQASVEDVSSAVASSDNQRRSILSSIKGWWASITGRKSDMLTVASRREF